MGTQTRFYARDVDLNASVGTRLDDIWRVGGYAEMHIELVRHTGTWATAVLEIEQSIGGMEWYPLNPAYQISAEGLYTRIAIDTAEFVTLKVVTAEGSAAEAAAIVRAVHIADDDVTIQRTVGLATRLDEASATITYVGKAATGSATSAAVWQIQRLTDTGSGLTVEWADGNDSFDNVWDNRASLSYS